jgi:hypothetical protein
MQKFMGCNVYVSRDAGLLHLSISRKDRLPSYDEVKSARYQFMSEAKYVVQIFPPEEDFVNVHEFCLHLWEPKEPFVYSELNVNGEEPTP